ncbi:hypothetical protein AB1K56_13335 [Microbacterium sp. BWR-S6Y]|uniref:hypothetical protein n=1 Tax=Microbacterium sp. BWR-S6Y TaxID=3232073 RepID=UPI0035286540
MTALRTPDSFPSAERILVMACSFAISLGLSVIGALVLAAVAFSQAITVCIPLVATFRGFVDEGGSNALTVDAAWGGVLASVVLMAAPLCVMALMGGGSGATWRG